MKIGGITGGIGSGKTMVCKIIEAMGYPVFYSDEVSFKLFFEPTVQRQIKGLLKLTVGDEEVLERAVVAQLVFENKDLLKGLNEIIHPIVFQEFNKWKDGINTRLGFVESALLVSSGMIDYTDFSVVVHCPEQLRIDRLMNQRQLSLTDIMKRMEAQKNIYSYTFDYSIINDDIHPLIPQIQQLFTTYG